MAEKKETDPWAEFAAKGGTLNLRRGEYTPPPVQIPEYLDFMQEYLVEATPEYLLYHTPTSFDYTKGLDIEVLKSDFKELRTDLVFDKHIFATAEVPFEQSLVARTLKLTFK